ncbi:hypothetical protein EJ06DRAFT_528796 [Trichodelitschia bisporula]|uniref:SP-RING-type domain-containing protein n=1 Tax=Trichodelitschia bisporula TaxID=703511 RepID=A0A6G1I0M3_9PEZI|nr:hypothetical protein EJ06DRAFT_528796 [Trichodelitschia bisporula]
MPPKKASGNADSGVDPRIAAHAVETSNQTMNRFLGTHKRSWMNGGVADGSSASRRSHRVSRPTSTDQSANDGTQPQQNDSTQPKLPAVQSRPTSTERQHNLSPSPPANNDTIAQHAELIPDPSQTAPSGQPPLNGPQTAPSVLLQGVPPRHSFPPTIGLTTPHGSQPVSLAESPLNAEQVQPLSLRGPEERLIETTSTIADSRAAPQSPTSQPTLASTLPLSQPTDFLPQTVEPKTAQPEDAANTPREVIVLPKTPSASPPPLVPPRKPKPSKTRSQMSPPPRGQIPQQNQISIPAGTVQGQQQQLAAPFTSVPPTQAPHAQVAIYTAPPPDQNFASYSAPSCSNQASPSVPQTGFSPQYKAIPPLSSGQPRIVPFGSSQGNAPGAGMGHEQFSFARGGHERRPSGLLPSQPVQSPPISLPRPSPQATLASQPEPLGQPNMTSGSAPSSASATPDPRSLIFELVSPMMHGVFFPYTADFCRPLYEGFIEHQSNVSFNGMEASRLGVLKLAIERSDAFYLFLHQIVCLNFLDRNSVPIPLLSMPEFDSALNKLDSILVSNTALSPVLVRWFANFPVALPQVAMNWASTYQIALKSLTLFFPQLDVCWDHMCQSSQQRGFPLIVPELVHRLALPSKTLVHCLFTAAFRSLLVSFPDHQAIADAGDMICLHHIGIYFEYLEQRGSRGPDREERSVFRRRFMNEFNQLLQPLRDQAALAKAQAQTQAFMRAQQVQQAQAQAIVQQAQAREQVRQAQELAQAQQAHTQAKARQAQAQARVRQAQAQVQAQKAQARQAQAQAHAQTSTPTHTQQPQARARARTQTRPAMLQTASTGYQSVYGPPGTPGGVQAQAPPRGGPGGFVPVQQTTNVPRTQVEPFVQLIQQIQTRLGQQHQQSPPQSAHPHQQIDRRFSFPLPPAPPNSAPPALTAFFPPHNGPSLPQPATASWRHTAIHQAHLRGPQLFDPDMAPYPWSPPANPLYQYPAGFAAQPISIKPDKHRYRLSFILDEAKMSKIPQTKKSNNGQIRHLQSGHRQYRVRCVKAHESLGNLGEVPLPDSLFPSAWVCKETSFPPNIYLSIEDHHLEIRRKIHWGKDMPIDITEFLRLGSNVVTISINAGSANQSDFHYIIGIEYVDVVSHTWIKKVAATHRRDPKTTLDAIKASLAPTRPDATGDVTMTNDDEDDDLIVASANITIPLVDPIAPYQLVSFPVRGRSCVHREGFDLDIFLQSRPREKLDWPSDPDSWRCPICRADVRPDVLCFDGFLEMVLKEAHQREKRSVRSVAVEGDGSWTLKGDPPSRDRGAMGCVRQTRSDPSSSPETPLMSLKTVAPVIIDLDDD